MTNTPIRTLRIADDLWRAAQAKAQRLGVTLSDVMREALEQFVNEEEDQ